MLQSPILFTHEQWAISLATIYTTIAVENVVPIDRPLPSTVGVPNLLVTVVSVDTSLIKCIEGSNRDRSIFPRVHCGRHCLSKPVVSIDYSVPPRQAKNASGYQPITNDEELMDVLLSANVFQHVSETSRHYRIFIVRDSFNNKSPVPVDDPVPTLSSICCFLQDRPEFDARAIVRRYVVAGIFDMTSLSSWTGPDWSISCLASTTASTESPTGRGMR